MQFKKRMHFICYKEAFLSQKVLLTYSICLLISISNTSCNSHTTRGNEADQNLDTQEAKPALVETSVIWRRTFSTELAINGRLKGAEEVPLYFKKAGMIKKILVANGSYVKAGDLLALIDSESEKIDLEDAALKLRESVISLDDQLITQGGRKADSLSVSSDVYSYLKLRSGYTRAHLEYKRAKLEFDRTFLHSPIDGRVANLTLTPFNKTPVEDPFCTLYDLGPLMAKCSVLESELEFLNINQDAKIQLMNSDKIYSAKVVGINPSVNSSGLVEVTVKMREAHPDLLPGMNVIVRFLKTYSNKLLVPKRSVVNRRDRKVVFTFALNKAKWNYVTLGDENNNEFVILSGLKEGDEVIISGNLNLANDASVIKK